MGRGACKWMADLGSGQVEGLLPGDAGLAKVPLAYEGLSLVHQPAPLGCPPLGPQGGGTGAGQGGDHKTACEGVHGAALAQ